MANPYSAKPADVKWTRGPVLLNNLTLEPSAADSTHSTVKIAGEMPTPCHQLRLAIPDRADNDGTLRIEAWSVADPNTVCAQMMQPFSVQVQVPSSGVTSVSVNDQAVSRTR